MGMCTSMLQLAENSDERATISGDVNLILNEQPSRRLKLRLHFASASQGMPSRKVCLTKLNGALSSISLDEGGKWECTQVSECKLYLLIQ